MLHGRKKAQVPAADFAEKPVNGERVADVELVHHAHDVGGDLVLGQQVVAAHGLLVSRLAAPGDAVGVVQFRRAVEAETGPETLRRQKAAPFFVQ